MTRSLSYASKNSCFSITKEIDERVFRDDRLIFFARLRPAKTCIHDALLRILRAYSVRLILTGSREGRIDTRDGANLIFASRR